MSSIVNTFYGSFENPSELLPRTSSGVQEIFFRQSFGNSSSVLPEVSYTVLSRILFEVPSEIIFVPPGIPSENPSGKASGVPMEMFLGVYLRICSRNSFRLLFTYSSWSSARSSGGNYQITKFIRKFIPNVP